MMRRFWTLTAICLAAAIGVAWAQDTTEPQATKPAAPKATAHDKIQKALGAKVAHQFIDAPLTDVVQQLSKEMSIPIFLDTKALEDVGLPDDTPVNINVKGISSRSALRLMLKPLDLTYVINDEVLQITTVDVAESSLRTKVYPVSDIVVRNGMADFDPLIETLSSIVDPDSWEDVGGPGAMTTYKTSLVISHTETVLRKIDRVLASVRSAMKPSARQIPLEVTPQIEKAIRSKVNLNFKNAPLSDVAPQLAEVLGVPVVWDRRAMAELGIDRDTVVTVNLKNITASSALRLMLRGVDPSLTYVIRDETLAITSANAARPTITIYVVDDLCGADEEMETLIEAIQRTILPSSWAEVGGESDINSLNYGRSMLLVAQTSDGHQEVASFLEKLRSAEAEEHQKNPNLAEQLKPSKEFTLQTYIVNGIDSKSLTQLVKMIPKLMPGVWEADGAVLQEAAGRLIVKHQPTTHRELQKLLDKMGFSMMDAKQFGAGGGMGGGMGGFGGGGHF